MNIKKEYYAVIFILLIIFIIVIALVVKFKVLKKGGKSSTTTTEERIPFPAEGIFMAKNEDINKLPKIFRDVARWNQVGYNIFYNHHSKPVAYANFGPISLYQDVWNDFKDFYHPKEIFFSELWIHPQWITKPAGQEIFSRFLALTKGDRHMGRNVITTRKETQDENNIYEALGFHLTPNKKYLLLSR